MEYVIRLKAQAASIILNLASIAPETDPAYVQQVFSVERDFIVQTAGEIVKPLLSVVNQERIYFYKKWSA